MTSQNDHEIDEEAFDLLAMLDNGVSTEELLRQVPKTERGRRYWNLMMNVRANQKIDDLTDRVGKLVKTTEMGRSERQRNRFIAVASLAGVIFLAATFYHVEVIPASITAVVLGTVGYVLSQVGIK